MQMTNTFSWIEAFYPLSLNDFMTNSIPVGSVLMLKPLNHCDLHIDFKRETEAIS